MGLSSILILFIIYTLSFCLLVYVLYTVCFLILFSQPPCPSHPTVYSPSFPKVDLSQLLGSWHTFWRIFKTKVTSVTTSLSKPIYSTFVSFSVGNLFLLFSVWLRHISIIQTKLNLHINSSLLMYQWVILNQFGKEEVILFVLRLT